MKQIKVLGLVAIASLALVACEQQNKSQTDRPANTVTNPAPAAHDDKTSTSPNLGTTPAEKTHPTAMGGGPAVEGSREWARDEIAAARCDHHQSCGDVAKGKKFEDMDSCLTRVKADMDKDYPADKCAKIDKDRLSACTAKLKSQKCGGITMDPSECDRGKVCIEK